MKLAKNPVVGFVYRIGVKNIKKFINTESMVPISRIIAFRTDTMRPSPSVSNNNGMVKIGTNIIDMFGKIP